MTSNARDWGITLLRLWFGFLIAYTGYERFAPFSAIWNPFSTAHAASLVQLLGGAAIFLGVAVRLAALLTAAAAAFVLWRGGGFQLAALLSHLLSATMLVASLILILTGPGRMNLGTLFRRKR